MHFIAENRPKKMIRVEKFLCCLELETGGFVIGYSFLLTLFICLLFSLYWLIAAMFISSCEDIKEQIHNELKKIMESEYQKGRLHITEEKCNIDKTGMIIGYLVLILCVCLHAYCSWLLVQGTRTRSYNTVKPMMIFLAIDIALTVLDLVTFSFEGFGGAIRDLVICVYCFIVVYSLFKKFREEHDPSNDVKYLNSAEKV